MTSPLLLPSSFLVFPTRLVWFVNKNICKPKFAWEIAERQYVGHDIFINMTLGEWLGTLEDYLVAPCRLMWMYRGKIFWEKQGVVPSIICSEKGTGVVIRRSAYHCGSSSSVGLQLEPDGVYFLFSEKKIKILPSTFSPLPFGFPPFGNQLKCGKAMTRFRSSKIRSIPVCIYVVLTWATRKEGRSLLDGYSFWNKSCFLRHANGQVHVYNTHTTSFAPFPSPFVLLSITLVYTTPAIIITMN